VSYLLTRSALARALNAFGIILFLLFYSSSYHFSQFLVSTGLKRPLPLPNENTPPHLRPLPRILNELINTSPDRSGA
jgi:hypothetical protein